MKIKSQGGLLIAKIHYLAGRILAEMLREEKIEINPAQGRIMFALWQQDEISIKDLSKKTALKKTTLCSMLKRLEKMGYIKRRPSIEDKRSFLISRSDKDHSWELVYQEVSKRMTEIFYKDFTLDEIDYFENYLKRILENLSS